jgi:hypothetical protein
MNLLLMQYLLPMLRIHEAVPPPPPPPSVLSWCLIKQGTRLNGTGTPVPLSFLNFFFFRPKYSPHHCVPRHPQSMVSL